MQLALFISLIYIRQWNEASVSAQNDIIKFLSVSVTVVAVMRVSGHAYMRVQRPQQDEEVHQIGIVFKHISDVHGFSK